MQFLTLRLIYITEEFPFRSPSTENEFNIIYYSLIHTGDF